MKDILSKLSAIEASAPKKAAKKMLNEDSTTPPMNVSDKPASFKDIFETMAMQKPIPVVGKQGDTQETGAGFLNVTDNSPAAQALSNALGDLAGQKKVQIVMPTQGQSSGQPAQAGATGQPNQQSMQEEQLDELSPDLLKRAGAEASKRQQAAKGPQSLGTEFEGGIELNYEVNGQKTHVVSPSEAAEHIEKGILTPDTRVIVFSPSGRKTAMVPASKVPALKAMFNPQTPGSKFWGMKADKFGQAAKAATSRDQAKDYSAQQTAGMSPAQKRQFDKMNAAGDLAEAKQLKEKFASQQQAKLMYAAADDKDVAKKTGVSQKVAKEFIKKSHGQKVSKLPKKVKEADIPSTNGIDTMGAGLGAGRSRTTLEGKDEGKPGKNFAKIAKSAGERYGSKAAGERVAGAVRAKLAKQGKLEEAKPDFLDLDKDGNKKEPMKKAAADKKKKKVDESMNHRISAARLEGKSHGLRGHAHSGKRYEDLEEMKAYHEGYKEGLDECYGQGVYETAMPATVPGMASAAMPTMEDEMAAPSTEWKNDGRISWINTTFANKEGRYTFPSTVRMSSDADALKHIKSGQLTPDLEVLVGYPDDSKAKYKASEVPELSKLFKSQPSTGMDEGKLKNLGMAAALGATALGAGGMAKGAYDYHHKEVPGMGMSQSEIDKTFGHDPAAGRKSYFGTNTNEAEIDEGFYSVRSNSLKQELEKNGWERIPGHEVPGHARYGYRKPGVGSFYKVFDEPYYSFDVSFVKPERVSNKLVPLERLLQLIRGSSDNEAEMEEGNAFTAALAKTPKGGKFTVGGKTYTDRTSHDAKIDEYAFEAWDRELNNLLNEGTEVNEGLSVSISKGQENSPDSVTITAQDQEAEHLLAFVKNAGLGLFGDDNADTHSSAMSIQPAHGAPDEVGAGGVDVEVVDGNDGIMGLMQKLSGIQSAGADDYEDEEGDAEQLYGNHAAADKKDCGCDGDCECSDYDKPSNEETCNECGGMMEAGHSCGSKEMVDEVESEDQMEFEVAENNAPDSGAAETTADENAEAEEDKALALKSMNESFADILARFEKLAEGSGDEPKHPKHHEKDEKDYDDAEEEEEVKESADEDSAEDLTEWANNAGKKGTDASFEADIDFMTKVIAGGLNKPKSTGQTTVPVIAGQENRMHDHQGTVSDSVDDWVKLAGIK